MESRVLSGATTLSGGIPRLSKPTRLSPTCFAAARLAGAVDGSGGNLIWGRQLRPSILLESSSSPLASTVPVTTKREILQPSLAAGSSPAGSSDSSGDAKIAPVGFLEKYPALVTGFFFFMWVWVPQRLEKCYIQRNLTKKWQIKDNKRSRLIVCESDDPYGILPQHWQHNATKPSPPHAVMSRPPHSPLLIPPPLMSSSGDSASNYTGGENPLTPTPPSPGMALGFSQSTFTYEELAMATDGFSNTNLLGQGGFGYVHKGVLPSGKEVAVKQLKAGSCQGEREFQAEVETISRVHHRHLVTLVGYCITGSQRMLVYEFVPNNTLAFHLHGRGIPYMDWPTRMKIALGAAKGLAYLHEDCHPKIIHRDIKASNILLDSNFEAKVADFGLAKFCSDADTHISTRVMGTFGYLAPEYASSGKLTDKSDVFSFGVMLLELITGRRPFDYSTEDSLVDCARPLLTRALEEGNFDALVDHCLQKDYNHNEMVRMASCADSCVSYSAQRRPRMSQVLRALEGNLSLSDFKAEIRPGPTSPGSSNYDTDQFKEDLKRFRLGAQEYGRSAQSGPTNEHGSHPPGTISVAQQSTQEMEMGEMKKDD